MKIYADISPVPSQCGGRIIHSFRDYDGGSGYSLQHIKNRYGGMMLIATFNQRQFKAYEACCQKFKLIGQSTPIRNWNTGNHIFTAIFKA